MLEAGIRAGQMLHFKYVLQLLADFHKTFSQSPTVEHLELPPVENGGRLLVIGDLHGQLKDLLYLIDTYGYPVPVSEAGGAGGESGGEEGDKATPATIFFWNGDFVDRGAFGMEILLLLFAWKLVWPTAQFFNRGNHESRGQNEFYNREQHGCWGFLEEVAVKYPGLCGRDIYLLAHACFELLPLAAVLEGPSRVMVVHGGLFRNPGVKVTDIAAVNRKREIPLFKTNPTYGDTIMEDALWSDPMDAKG
jgi:hypothetical protein